MGGKESEPKAPQAAADVPPGQAESFIQPPATGQTVPLGKSAAGGDELTRLRALLAEEQAKRFAAEGEAFASRMLTAGKVLPIEQDALRAAYMQAATDDAEHQSATRVAVLTALMDARPAHSLTTELVPADTEMFVLANKTNSGGEDVEQAKASARAYAERMNGNGHTAGKGK